MVKSSSRIDEFLTIYKLKQLGIIEKNTLL